MASNSTTRVVFWQNREEWLYVYKALFNFDDAAAQRKGLDRVDAWRSRSAGKLPLGIDCTAYLISAELSLGNVTCSMQRKLILAMAIVRFVNGMTDQEQKGLYGRTVQSLAAEIGLPDWLVELRHDATHMRLPSLESLKWGLYEGLKWLKTEYWEAQSILHDGNEDKLLQLLIDFKITPDVSRAESIANTVCTCNFWSFLPSVLFTEGILIPLQDELSPAELVKTWKPLLEALDKLSTEFTTSLMMYLIQNLSNDAKISESYKQSCYFAWINILLKAFSDITPTLMFNNNVSWVVILQVCLENPTTSSSLIPQILEKIRYVSDSLKDKIKHLLSVFLDKDHGESWNAVEKHQYFDLEELVAERKHKLELLSSSKQQDDTSSSDRGWKVSQGATQWQLIPFGEILGVSYITPSCLELSSHREDSPDKEVDVECVNLTENHSVINREAVDETNDDYDDNDDDNMSIDNEESCQCAQDYEADAILVEDQNGKSLEQDNAIGSISNKIYLF